jgi:hypothetical protein
MVVFRGLRRLRGLPGKAARELNEMPQKDLAGPTCGLVLFHGRRSLLGLGS